MCTFKGRMFYDKCTALLLYTVDVRATLADIAMVKRKSHTDQ